MQATLVALHLTGALPEAREDLVRLATGESFVRPTTFARVRPDTAAVLTVEADIGNGAPHENGNIAIDAAIGIRPVATTAPNVAAASSTATGKGVGKNGTPFTAPRLMNETLVHTRCPGMACQPRDFRGTDPNEHRERCDADLAATG